MLKLFLSIYNNAQCYGLLNANATSVVLISRNFHITRTGLRPNSPGKPHKSTNPHRFRYFLSICYCSFRRRSHQLFVNFERRYPRIVSPLVYFSKGSKNYFLDVAEYFRIVNKLKRSTSLDKFDSLTLREVEIYEKMPRDMIHLTPIMVMTWLPIIGYFVLPISYGFPRQLLSSHFWTPQQKLRFELSFMKKRVIHYKPFITYLQDDLKNYKDHELHEEFADLLELLKRGNKPEVQQILRCKALFQSKPYGLPYLGTTHVWYLMKIHSITAVYDKKYRLEMRAKIIKEMDKAIGREGGVLKISEKHAKKACFIRGVNPYGMKNDERLRWLKDWLTVSAAVKKNSLSLLLHCSLFLGCNEICNLQLLNNKK